MGEVWKENQRAAALKEPRIHRHNLLRIIIANTVRRSEILSEPPFFFIFNFNLLLVHVRLCVSI